MGHPQPKIKSWNEARYRALHWIRERLYERSVGHLLKEGVTPPGLAQINQTLGAAPLAASLPYEVYDDGWFVSDDTHGRAWYLEQTLARAAIAPVLARLQPGQLIQLGQVFEAGQRLGGFVSVNSQATLSGAGRTDLDPLVSSLNSALPLWEAQDLLNLTRPLVAAGLPAPPYEAGRLLSCQFGDTRLIATPDGICLQNAAGARVYRAYSVRCGALCGRSSIHHVLPNLAQLDSCRITASLCRADNGVLQGQLIILAEKSLRSDSIVRAAFADQGWLIESELAQPHLALLSSLPLMSGFLRQLIDEQRRFQPMTDEEALRLVPVRLTGGGSQ